MKIPDKLKILGIDVRTVFDDEIMGEDNLGLCDHSHAIIFLKSKHESLPVPGDIAALMYIHEVLHYIDLTLDIGLNEKQIVRLAAGVHQVFTENDIDWNG